MKVQADLMVTIVIKNTRRYASQIEFTEKREQMKITRQQSQENRQKILTAAWRLFREKGFDGVGVDEVAKLAELSPSVIYRHFGSKGGLLTAVCAQAMEAAHEVWRQELPKSDDVLSLIAKEYLHLDHIDRVDGACPVPVLATDAAHRKGEASDVFRDGLQAFFEILGQHLHRGNRREDREAAISIWASLTGAILLARAVNNEKLASEILRAVGAQLRRM